MDLAQMAGWFAAGAAIIAMLQKSDLRLKQGLIIHTVLYGIHFALLGLPTAVISCVIALARISLSIYTRSLLCAAVLIISVATALTVSRSTVEILPLAASVVLTLSLFRFDGIKLRLGLLAGSVLWLIHNIYVQSWGGICLEACFCLSTLWGLWTMVQEQNENSKKEVCP
ncbi:YgjV family protein [Parasutterella excrementihominis]|uniref:YgjV family protein n=1 Tax=Parasutterella excrementihominis TaxID=487175 RepID=UPI00242C3939|nr:YgjV family protein [Parasutterella excrementihominis]